MLAACVVFGAGYWGLDFGDGELKIFGRWDVLAVCTLSALPIAVLIAGQVARQSKVVRGIAGGLSAIAIVLCVYADGDAGALLSASRLSVSAFHGLLAVAATTLVISVLSVVRIGKDRELGLSCSRRVGLLFAVMAVALPSVYTDSVSKTMTNQLNRALSNQRTVKAAAYARKLRHLRPRARIGDVAIATLIESLQSRIADLEAVASRSLSPRSPASSLANRVTALVQLEHLDEALIAIRPLLSGDKFHPASFDFYGLCFQRLGDPGQSLIGYQMAIQFWADQPDSIQKRQSLESAWKGVAFAARQLSNRRMEERAFHELLAVAPAASNHLLLAQCYKEHQKMALAVKHAKQAAAMDPALQPRLEAISASIARDHLGCLGGVK
ncbi:hypothetical protein K239x_16720 [Planctomycetes bacterium K23_9]|uniref:Tetratricopeptide repeat protein n=2 Tax=Stieleria marina TaxID=1930275 RepID=A0A517NRI3_9BACT|nr:hypothetical protein K239x_16720 [Planctomycetes bacterium K23_9]